MIVSEAGNLKPLSLPESKVSMSFEDEKGKDFKLAAHQMDSQAQKSKKRTYLCNLCNITLNSQQTMEIHCKGVR